MKKLTALFLMVFLSLPILFQLPEVKAQTSPITGPITTPISFFNLTGDVTYKKLGRLFSGIQRVVPGEDVLVKVSNFFNPGQSFETMTDDEGNYKFNLPAGLYKVEVEDGDHTFFVPPLKVVKVQEEKAKKANFQGLIFP